jgi:hypothetical protein
MKYTINSKHFRSQKEIDNHYSNIIAKYEWGEPISAEDHMDAIALLDFHPDKAEKMGCGMSHIEVRRNTHEAHGFNTKCFFVVRTDGTAIDFSKSCLKHIPKNK